MKHIDYRHVELKDGFWKTKLDMVRDTTVRAVYDRFCDTHRFSALKCLWKPGDPDQPHIFWDSDVAKWLEGAAYLLAKEENKELEAIAEETIAAIIQNSDENGYFNSHFLVTEQENRFKLRSHHELYCAGHLIEAAVAYFEATGRDAFLKAMCRFADYIEKVFKIEQSAAFRTPGHPELELALLRLYRCTGEKRYLELARFFIDEHGSNSVDKRIYPQYNEYYNQDEMPLRQRSTAEGHSVRSLYLLSAMADLAEETGDEELKAACERCFKNIVTRRMYITGGVGSTHNGETFTIDYHLPNRTAYAETCAAISLAMFSNRMLHLEPKGAYADTVERTLFNGILSGVSMDGKSFFYENPLEIDPKFNHVNTSTEEKERWPITQRVEVFSCSCCPPNIVRFIPSVAGMLYAYDENTVFVHQYAHSAAEENGVKITVETNYPAEGTVKVHCTAPQKKLALRIPGWCRKFTLNCSYEMKDGYAYIDLQGEATVELTMDMPVTPMAANREVHAGAGRIAFMRGPVVYCAEGVDNGEDLVSVLVDAKAACTLGEEEFILPNLYTTACRPAKTEELYAPAEDDPETIPLKLIPYYAFANRGETEMHVWLLRKY